MDLLINALFGLFLVFWAVFTAKFYLGILWKLRERNVPLRGKVIVMVAMGWFSCLGLLITLLALDYFSIFFPRDPIERFIYFDLLEQKYALAVGIYMAVAFYLSYCHHFPKKYPPSQTARKVDIHYL